jgi:hypothetical protein
LTLRPGDGAGGDTGAAFAGEARGNATAIAPRANAKNAIDFSRQLGGRRPRAANPWAARFRGRERKAAPDAIDPPLSCEIFI